MLAALVGSASGCAPEPPPEPLPPLPAARCEPLPPPSGESRRNLVLILTDTTRRDRLAPYGGPATTPRLDAFAREAIVFTAAESQAPWTKPSIASLFTGLVPSAHGVISHPELRGRAARAAGGERVVESDVLAASHTTLAEALSAAGYETAAFVSNPWLKRELGFAQGFQTYEDAFADNTTPGEKVTRAGLDWLRSRPDASRPYFLYLHYMDAHSPFHGVPRASLEARWADIEADDRPVSPASQQQIAKLALDERRRPLVEQGLPANLALMELVYDEGVAHFDRAFGGFLDGFAGQPGAEETAIVVTSDHGEALHEHGWLGHGHGLFSGETGVPLLARLPGIAPAVNSCPAALVDLRRSLCDYLGVSCLTEQDQGVSFFSGAFADPHRSVVTEGVIGKPRNQSHREARFKLVEEPDGRLNRPGRGTGRSLYDLERDPGEQTDLLQRGASPEARAAYQRLVERSEAHAQGPRGEAEKTELDPAMRERLKALGYLDE